MKCKVCGTLLSPYLLREVLEQDGKLLFDIECPNPHCRWRNYVSQAFYFHSKKDFIYNAKKKLKFTTRLPGEVNVMFVSMDRCGISWIVRRLSKIHEIMFGLPLDYSPEISRLLASRKRFPLPLGWYNVYDVDPELLLKRAYDYVISIQRPLRIMYRVLAMYYMPTLTYEECREQYPAYFEKIDRYYNIVYGKIDKIKDPRFKNFTLPDLNNYTVDTFHEIMDFLNFPKMGRPVLFPVNPPERNWQAYSTTLTKTEPIGMKLREIQEKYEFGMLEYDIQRRKQKYNPPVKIDMNQYPPSKYRKKPKVAKTLPFEREIQDNRKFRMYSEDIVDALESNEKYNILVLGPIGNGYGCHMSELLYKAFTQLGHNVDFINQQILAKEKRADSQRVSAIIKKHLNNKKPDLIFLSEMRIRIINDLDIYMPYFHTGWYLPPNVIGAHIHYFRQSQIVDAYRKKGRVVDTLYPCVDPNSFYPEPKTVKGVCGIGFRRTWQKWFEIVGSLQPLVGLMKKETDYFIKLGYKYYPTPVEDLQYRAILRRIEALNPLTANGGYITRRMLEGMACKTLMIFRLDFVLKDGKRDSSIHRNMLREMGYYAGEHYIEINNAKEIKKTWNNLTEVKKDWIKENAYKHTLKTHTPINRAKQIIDDYESGKWKDAIYYPDNEEDAERRERAKQARIKETQEIEDLVIK